jgi:hypothetical protein
MFAVGLVPQLHHLAILIGLPLGFVPVSITDQAQGGDKRRR